MTAEAHAEARAADDFALIGRETELAWLHTWWDTAARLDETSMVVVAGESGAGKTRLIRDFANELVGASVQVLHGQCTEHRFLPYEPWMTALRAHLDALDPATRAEVIGDQAPALASIPWLYDLAPGVAPASRGQPDELAVRGVVTDLIRRLSRSSPLLMVIDDVQWADSGSVGVLAGLREARLPGCGIVVVERRPFPQTDAWVGATLAADHVAAELHVGRLDRDACGALVRSALADEVPESLAEAVHRSSGGNAFVAVTLATLIGRSGLGPDQIVAQLPSTASALWAARVQEASPAALRLLMIAAVAGSECELSLLRLVAEESTIDDGVEEAVATGLVAVSDDELRFSHSLVREYVYDGLTRTRRQRLHRAVAQNLAQRVPDGPSEHSVRLAYHWSRSGTAGRREVVTHLVAATQWNFGLGASNNANETGAQALSVLEELDRDGGAGPALLASYRAELGDVLLRSGHPAAVTVMMDAARYFERVDDVPTLARIAEALLRAGQFIGTTTAGTDLATSLVGRLDAVDPRLQSRILGRLSRSLEGRSGAGPLQAELSATALALARASGDPDTIAVALFCHCTDRPWTDDRQDQIRELIDIGERHDHVGYQLHGLTYLHTLLLDQGDIAECDAVLARAETIRDRLSPGYAGLLRNADLAAEADALVAMRKVHRAQVAGRFDEQDAIVAELSGYLDRAGVERDRLIYTVTTQLGLLAWDRGAMDDFAPLAVAFAEEQPDSVHRQICAAFVTAVAGDEERARTYYQPLIDGDLEALTVDQITSSMLILLAHTAFLLDDRRGARPIEAALSPFDGRNSCFIGGCFGPTSLGLALCSVLGGDVATAERRFTEAIAQCETWGAVTYLARALVGRAQLRAARGLDQTARGDASRALEIAERLGMRGVAASARRLVN